MRKTFDQTPCMDPQTMAMIHQAAHYAIHEGLLPQVDLQDLKQILALDLIQHQPGFLNSRFKWTTYCARMIQRKLKQLKTANRSSQRATGATDLNANERAWRGVWSSFERWINQEQELTQFLTSLAADQNQKPGPGRWHICTTMKQTERWTTDQAGNKHQGTTQIETHQKRTWTPAPEKTPTVAAARKKPTGPTKSKKRPARPSQTESTIELGYQVQTERKTA